MKHYVVRLLIRRKMYSDKSEKNPGGGDLVRIHHQETFSEEKKARDRLAELVEIGKSLLTEMGLILDGEDMWDLNGWDETRVVFTRAEKPYGDWGILHGPYQAEAAFKAAEDEDDWEEE
ncbi:MAG: hypothetical protein J6Y62_03870 [Clostridia bacterium]|nr:hypothetical protein [Clostridia bacterium]